MSSTDGMFPRQTMARRTRMIRRAAIARLMMRRSETPAIRASALPPAPPTEPAPLVVSPAITVRKRGCR